MRARTAGSASVAISSASRSTSASSGATLSATSSGSSANQPTSLTSRGLPRVSARIVLPDVSPIVGERSETTASTPASSAQKRASSTYPSRTTASPRRRRSRAAPTPAAPTSKSRAVGCNSRKRANASRSCGTRFAAFANATFDEARVDDHARCDVEYLPAQRKIFGPHLPKRRNAAVDHAEPEQPAGQARVALECREIAALVLAPERQARHQMVEDEVVQHDDAGLVAKPLDDPAVRLGIVSDVVERDVAVRLLPARSDVDLYSPPQRRQQERRVVGDARALRRHRAVVRDCRPRAARANGAWRSVRALLTP